MDVGMKELEPFRDFELAEDLDQSIDWYFKLSDAMAYLKELKKELDKLEHAHVII